MSEEVVAFVPFEFPRIEPIAEPEPPEMASYGDLTLPAETWSEVWRGDWIIEPTGVAQ